MSQFIALFTSKYFLAPAIAWAVAQLFKLIIDCFRSGFSKERFKSSTGMPSSHGAIIGALIVITGYFKGANSLEFVVILFFGLIVLFDARGVRFETQRQGKALNNLNEERSEEGKQPLDILKFNEKLGHTVPEIVVGCIVGVISAIVVYHLPI
jgi:hypothetical protein